MSEPAPDRFETVAWVYDPSDLALLLSLFESEDIFVLPIGRWHASVDPPLTTALGGVEQGPCGGCGRRPAAAGEFAANTLPRVNAAGPAPAAPGPDGAPAAADSTFVLRGATAPRCEPYEG